MLDPKELQLLATAPFNYCPVVRVFLLSAKYDSSILSRSSASETLLATDDSTVTDD